MAENLFLLRSVTMSQRRIVAEDLIITYAVIPARTEAKSVYLGTWLSDESTRRITELPASKVIGAPHEDFLYLKKGVNSIL